MKEFFFALGQLIIMNIDKILLVFLTIPFLVIGVLFIKRCFICLSSSDNSKEDDLL